MFETVTLESAVFMGKNFLDNRHSIKNTKDLTLKQMFDISATLVSEQNENLWFGDNGFGNSFMDIYVFDR